MRVKQGGTQLPPIRTYEVNNDIGAVRIAVLKEGDGKTFPAKSCEAHVIGRLQASGCVFESTRAKGRPAMKMELGRGTIIPGMDMAVPTLSLGTLAELEIPAALAYGRIGVPRVVPADAALIFEVDLTSVDGQASASSTPQRLRECHLATEDESAEQSRGSDINSGCIMHPFWLARQELLPPPLYYLNFCRFLARGGSPSELLPRARWIPRTTREEVEGWDLTGGARIIESDKGVQSDWRARREWDLDWFRRELGHHHQLLKWIGPVFTRQENLWEQPVWEASVAEYIDYIRVLEEVDPDCKEENAAACPRLYLNGWPCFVQLPHMREFVSNPTFFDDANARIFREHEELRESFLMSLAHSPTPPAQREQALLEEYWEMTKLFISPKGAITRLHFDNGGAHAWLSQVRGRKLFICFAPEDGKHLHAFAGDEGLMSGSWVDPLDPDADTKWPDYSKATPWVGILEEGETIVAPQGWWHYAASLETSITVMRNFYSEGNKQELFSRKDATLEEALVKALLRPRSKDKSDEELRQGAKKLIAKVRDVLQAQKGAGAGQSTTASK